jgi:hypothetical protein
VDGAERDGVSADAHRAEVERVEGRAAKRCCFRGDGNHLIADPGKDAVSRDERHIPAVKRWRYRPGKIAASIGQGGVLVGDGGEGALVEPVNALV